MKQIPIYTIVILFGLLGCSSQKKLTETAPFVIMDPSVQDFAAGREEGGTGFTLKFPLKEYGDDISFVTVYFRGHQLQPTMEMGENTSVLICEFKRENSAVKPDIIMHSDSREEVGNQPPGPINMIPDEKPAFELKADEAVLGYKEKGKKRIKFFKVSGIKEKAPKVYPSRPKN
jgi:hypothetical protein